MNRADFLIREHPRQEQVRKFFRLLQKDPLARRCFAMYQQGAFDSFEEMLMYCVLRLAETNRELIEQVAQTELMRPILFSVKTGLE